MTGCHGNLNKCHWDLSFFEKKKVLYVALLDAVSSFVRHVLSIKLRGSRCLQEKCQAGIEIYM